MNAVVDAPALLANRMTLVPYSAQYEAQVVKLAREMHAESVAHGDIPMNETKLLAQLRAAESLPDTVYFKLCVRGDEVIGGFFGLIVTLYFSDERAAMDRAWFVTKERRGGAAAVMLVRDFEEWAGSKGVTNFCLGQSTGVRTEVTAALYRHLGYNVVGVNTVKRKR